MESEERHGTTVSLAFSATPHSAGHTEDPHTVSLNLPPESKTQEEVLPFLMHWFSLNLAHYDQCNVSSAISCDEQTVMIYSQLFINSLNCPATGPLFSFLSRLQIYRWMRCLHTTSYIFLECIIWCSKAVIQNSSDVVVQNSRYIASIIMVAFIVFFIFLFLDHTSFSDFATHRKLHACRAGELTHVESWDKPTYYCLFLHREKGVLLDRWTN